jgi:hypothetical protein
VKLTTTEPNYCATIVRVHATVPLDGLDRLVGVPIYGYQAIVSKDVSPGSLMVLFTAETQLSEAFCKANNLYRKKEKNANPEATGYLEDSGRVRAIKFKGNNSNALLLSLDSLAYLGDTNDLKEGDTFNLIGGFEVCRKYQIPANSRGNGPGRGGQPKRDFVRVEARLVPEHFDTANYWKNQDRCHGEVVVTQKLHGTSVRIFNQLVNRRLAWWEKALVRLGVRLQTKEYGLVVGTRRTIKGESKGDPYYKEDVYTKAGEEIYASIPKGFGVYGELIGWVGESPIQKGYTYGIPKGKADLYVYRVVHINADGLQFDLAWDQVKEFCRANGLKHVPEMWRGDHRKVPVIVEDLMDKKFRDAGFQDCVPLGEDSPVDEGVCVLVGGITPRIYKAKSPVFLGHETKLLDQGVTDMEEAAS